MDSDIKKLSREEFPELLSEISDPPEKLYIRGELPDWEGVFLSVVGSRKYTSYGKDACEKLILGLRGFPITIVSGLALGIDSIAHEAAISAGLKTVAVPGSGLNWNVLYPRLNLNLAKKIAASGGALLSEFEPDFKPTTWSFPQRNRIMAGLSRAVLIIEAEEKSGSLITARLALDYNRDVLAVPGSIFSSSSEGTNRLIKEGATVITRSEDILRALGFKIEDKPEQMTIGTENLSPEEAAVMKIIKNPLPKDELIRALGFPTSKANILLSAMEIKGLIREREGLVEAA